MNKIDLPCKKYRTGLNKKYHHLILYNIQTKRIFLSNSKFFLDFSNQK